MNPDKEEKKVILLVDDHVVNRHIVRAMLRNEPIILDVAENGRQALDSLVQRHYDLVLMDCQMPEMTGMEATRAIRDGVCGAENVRIPIIAMTAHAFDKDRLLCMESGMDDYILKPIDQKVLITMVNKWLNGDDEKAGAVAGGDVNADAGVIETHFDLAGMKVRLMDDIELISIIVDSYLEDFPTQLQQVQQCIADGDVIAAGKQGHRIKGSSSNVGAVLIQQNGLCIERAGHAGDLNAASDAVAALPELFDKYSQVVHQLLSLEV